MKVEINKNSNEEIDILECKYHTPYILTLNGLNYNGRTFIRVYSTDGDRFFFFDPPMEHVHIWERNFVPILGKRPMCVESSVNSVTFTFKE